MCSWTWHTQKAVRDVVGHDVLIKPLWHLQRRTQNINLVKIHPFLRIHFLFRNKKIRINSLYTICYGVHHSMLKFFFNLWLRIMIQRMLYYKNILCTCCRWCAATSNIIFCYILLGKKSWLIIIHPHVLIQRTTFL